MSNVAFEDGINNFAFHPYAPIEKNMEMNLCRHSALPLRCYSLCLEQMV
jgi:hypothetical protein